MSVSEDTNGRVLISEVNEIAEVSVFTQFSFLRRSYPLPVSRDTKGGGAFSFADVKGSAEVSGIAEVSVFTQFSSLRRGYPSPVSGDTNGGVLFC